MPNETSPLLTDRDETVISGHGTFVPNGHSTDNDASRIENAEQTERAEPSKTQLMYVVGPLGIGIFLAAMDQTVVVACKCI